MVNYRLIITLLIYFALSNFLNAQKVFAPKNNTSNCTFTTGVLNAQYIDSDSISPVIFSDAREQQCYTDRIYLNKSRKSNLNIYTNDIALNHNSYQNITWAAIKSQADNGLLVTTKRYKILMQNGKYCYARAINEYTLYEYVFVVIYEEDNCIVFKSKAYNLFQDLIY